MNSMFIFEPHANPVDIGNCFRPVFVTELVSEAWSCSKNIKCVKRFNNFW